MSTRTLTAHERRRFAIAEARERRERELAPLRAEVDRLVAEVGWRQARPIVVEIMAPLRVTGPRGAWRSRVGKRAAARILAELGALPVQERLALPVSLPSRNVHPRGDSPCTS